MENVQDELRTMSTFEEAKVSDGDDANRSASAAVAQVEHLVLRATAAGFDLVLGDGFLPVL